MGVRASLASSQGRPGTAGEDDIEVIAWVALAELLAEGTL